MGDESSTTDEGIPPIDPTMSVPAVRVGRHKLPEYILWYVTIPIDGTVIELDVEKTASSIVAR